MSALRPHLWELARFGVVGAINTFLGLIFIYGFMALHVGPYLSNFLGYAIGFVISFSINRRWTFRSGERVNAGLIGRFALAVAISYGCNLAVVYGCTQARLDPHLAQLTGLPAYTACFYLLSKFFVFRKTEAAGSGRAVS